MKAPLGAFFFFCCGALARASSARGVVACARYRHSPAPSHLPMLPHMSNEYSFRPGGTENRRQHYRITYPPAERPRFVHGTTISEVLECSERGLRLRLTGELPAPGSPMSGRLTLRHGVQVNVAGKVVWCDEDNVAIHLDVASIPLLAVIREQLYLRRLTFRTY